MLTDDQGRTDESTFAQLVDQIAVLRAKGCDVIVVSSGAMGFGRGELDRGTNDDENVADKQLFATVGQVALMQRYREGFKQHGLHCAQVLVTKEDFRDRNHYYNMRNCFMNLLHEGVIPIVNENDAIAIQELVFTDNDELAGLVATQVDADAVMILSSVDGFLKAGEVVEEISYDDIPTMLEHVSSEKTLMGRGGMMSKCRMAKKLMAAGVQVYLANGKTKSIIENVLHGKAVCTKFIPKKRASNVKRRLAHSEGLTMGAVVVNECTSAMFADREKVFSLLPVGIERIEGEFSKGDVIEIRNYHNEKIGFGIATCDGVQAAECAGTKGGKPVIHYNYMFIE